MRKKKKLMNSILATVCVLLFIAVIIVIVGINYLTDKNRTITELTNEMNANKQVLYVASQFIGKGEQIQDGVNVMQQEVYTGLEPYNYITADDLGCIALIDIEEKMPIMCNMTAPEPIDQDTREYEMRVVNLMGDQQENDTVDIRIMFPTGEDFIVLAKKQVRGLNLEAATFMANLNEEEILRMASATVDAFTVTGTRIYATRYVEDNLQEASIPDYLVRQETIDLINSDPNILTKAQETLNRFARLEMEERLTGEASEALTAVNDGHGLTDLAGGSALLGNSNTQSQTLTSQTAEEPETPAETETGDEAAEEIRSKEAGH